MSNFGIYYHTNDNTLEIIKSNLSNIYSLWILRIEKEVLITKPFLFVDIVSRFKQWFYKNI